MKNGKLAALLNTPAGAVIAVGMIIIVVELLTTMVIENVFPLSMHNFLYLFDPILLIAIVSPALYFLVFRPMRKQQAELEDARKRIGQAFQEWIAALDAVNDPIFLHDKDFHILRCNKAYQQCAGLPFKQIIGRPYYEVFPKADSPLPNCLHAMEKAEEEEEEVTVGDAIYRSRAFSIHNEQGAYLYSIHTLEDITERKRAEAIRTRLMEHLESSPDFVGFADANDAHILYINRAGRAMTGIWEDEDVTKLKVADVHPAWTNRMFEEVILPAAVSTGGWQGECAFLHRDGHEIPVSMVLRAHKSANGAIDVFSTTSRDITERKQAEKALKGSEEKNRLLFESSRDALMTLAPPSWKFTGANQATLKLFGASSVAEFVALGPWEVSPERQPDGRPSSEKAQEMIATAMREGSHFFEWEHQRLDGQPFAADVLLTRMKVGEDVFLQATVRDITERKRKEGEYRTLIQTSLDGFWINDFSGRLLDVNEALCQMLGYTREELLRMSIPDVEASEALEETAAHIQKIIRTGSDRFQTRHRRKDGAVIDVEASAQYVAELGERFFAFVRDITERKQADEAIRHANRALATLSAVNRNLVHATDENELLQAICDAIVEQRGYLMAWVGYKQHDESKSIKIMAHAGHDVGYLDTAQISWGEAERGMGPSGRAVRSGTTQLCQDMANDALFLPWRDAALKRGYAATIALPLLNGDGTVFGILNVYAAETNAFTPNEVDLLEEMAGDLAFGVRSLHTRRQRDLAMEQSQRHLEKLRNSLEDTVRAMAGLVEMRDPYTAGHQARVANLAAAIARQMGLPEEQVHAIHLAGTVHDLGKINIPAEVLSKPGKITAIEFNLIKNHPQAGYEILQGIDFPWPIAQMVLQHHERLDGSGYPQGLKGEAILLEARILSVADVVEAISAHRPYRPGLGIETALAEITKLRGSHFDPAVVDACLTVFREQHYSFNI